MCATNSCGVACQKNAWKKSHKHMCADLAERMKITKTRGVMTDAQRAHITELLQSVAVQQAEFEGGTSRMMQGLSESFEMRPFRKGNGRVDAKDMGLTGLKTPAAFLTGRR